MQMNAEVLTGQHTGGNAIKGTLVLVAAQSLSRGLCWTSG